MKNLKIYKMMRIFLLSLCTAVLLSGCSDDDTKGGTPPPVISDAQFAAAIDDLPTETRAAIADGMTTWEAGDEVGITAMIDGTPYVRNVPYKFTEATDFGELTAVAGPILWNESVRGERSFFACWPYKQSDDGYPEMDKAWFGIAVPAEQEVVDGVNTARPVLVGSGVTTAVVQRPVPLRFTNLFPVLNLKFEPFAETAISQITIEPAQEAVFDGYLSVTGAIASTGEMSIDESSGKIVVKCAGDGLNLAHGGSVQIPVGRFTVTGGLNFTATTTDDRTFSETVFADGEWSSFMADASGNFSKAKYINHTMALEVVSDVTTEVYFSDDLNWITSSSRWASGNTGGGWPTVTAGASATGKANYFTVDLLPEFASEGYVRSVNRTSVQARYEGYICLGTTSAQGALITPALADIGDVPTDILVSFYGATYASENLQADGKPLTVKVLGAGTIGEEDATEIEIGITNYFSWRKYWIIVKGATSATQIQFGQDVAQSVGRVLVDEILIGKAVKGAVAGSKDVPANIAPYLRTLDGEPGVKYEIDNAEGAAGACIVQSNLPWTASTEADWIAVSPSVEYNGTGVAYLITVTARSLNGTGAVRTADVTFAAGELTKTVTFTQTGEIPERILFEDDFSWCDGDGTTGGIFDATLSGSTTIGSGGKAYNSWTEAYKATGWTKSMAVNSPTTRNGTLLCGGTTAAAGDVISPVFAGIGDGTMDIVVEYDVLAYKNANETGKTILTVQGGGTVESYSGHYTGVSPDTFTGLNADKTVLSYYCGNYAGWTGGDARWHHITVVIKGATKDTRIQLAGFAGYSRFWLDNFKVTPKKN